MKRYLLPICKVSAALALLAFLVLGDSVSITSVFANDGDPAKKQLQETPQEVTETKTVRTPIKSGRWIFIDQATGKPSYTTEGPESVELPDDLANAFSKSSEGLKMVTMPDGSMMVDLSKRFQHASFVGINSEGKAVTSCLAPGGAHNTACAHNSDVSSTEKAGEENK